MKILVIDNYDSFTYNLVYILRQEKVEVDVYRNDKITPAQCLLYDGIVLSPGPGVPKAAGNLKSIISTCAGIMPLFGVCLGHQAIAEYLGGNLRVLDKVYHGIQSSITISKQESILLNQMLSPFKAGRYHSLDVLDSPSNQFETTAISDNGSIMAIENLDQKLFGIQFHPESILTPDGRLIIQNFLRFCQNKKL
jgi:anthranilate synthase component 2